MNSLRSAAVQYTNYGTGGAFELPTQSGTLYICIHITPNMMIKKLPHYFWQNINQIMCVTITDLMECFKLK